MKTKTSLAAFCLVLLPAMYVSGGEQNQRVNSRAAYAYYNAEQALAMARLTGKPIFIVSIRGNDCAGGL